MTIVHKPNNYKKLDEAEGGGPGGPGREGLNIVKSCMTSFMDDPLDEQMEYSRLLVGHLRVRKVL